MKEGPEGKKPITSEKDATAAITKEFAAMKGSREPFGQPAFIERAIRTLVNAHGGDGENPEDPLYKQYSASQEIKSELGKAFDKLSGKVFTTSQWSAEYYIGQAFKAAAQEKSDVVIPTADVMPAQAGPLVKGSQKALTSKSKADKLPEIKLESILQYMSTIPQEQRAGELRRMFSVPRASEIFLQMLARERVSGRALERPMQEQVNLLWQPLYEVSQFPGAALENINALRKAGVVFSEPSVNAPIIQQAPTKAARLTIMPPKTEQPALSPSGVTLPQTLRAEGEKTKPITPQAKIEAGVAAAKIQAAWRASKNKPTAALAPSGAPTMEQQPAMTTSKTEEGVVRAFITQGNILFEALKKRFMGVSNPREAQKQFSALDRQGKIEINRAVREEIKAKIAEGVLQEVKPRAKEGSTEYEVGDGKVLAQTKRADGLFSFTPPEGFTGLITVERWKDSSKTQKLSDSIDSIQYVDGKVVSVIEGAEGVSRVAGLDKLMQLSKGEEIDIAATLASQLTTPPSNQNTVPNALTTAKGTQIIGRGSSQTPIR